jgi:outer membrane translocation and assembly module TamA
LKYTFEESQQYFDIGLTLGTSIDADRLSAYRLGGFLPFVAEFPLNIPGYYYQEISAESFGLLSAEYSFPFTPGKSWRLSFYGAGAVVDNLDTHEQDGRWHSGLGAGVTYVSPRGAWFVSLVYGHGFRAVRHDDHGANNVGILFQYDFDAVRKFPYRRFEPNVSPYSSRGGERIFR